MKFEKISVNKIRVTLTESDLEEWNIDLDDPNFPPNNMQDLFWHMMKRVEDELGIILDNCRLMIEPSANEDDGMVLLITRYDDEEFKNRSAQTIRHKATSNTRPDLLFVFQSFEDVVNGVKQITHLPFRKSSLFSYRDQYYLFISRTRRRRETVLALQLALSEYATETTATNWRIGVLNEHGKCVMPTNAIKTIMTYFLKDETSKEHKTNN